MQVLIVLVVAAIASSATLTVPTVGTCHSIRQSAASFRVVDPHMAVGAGKPVELEADAEALLSEANGDANKARMNMIGYTMAFIQEEQPEVYEALTKQPERPDCHEALVEITWDSIAAFLPVTHSPTPTPGAARRLEAIAKALVEVDDAGSEDAAASAAQ